MKEININKNIQPTGAIGRRAAAAGVVSIAAGSFAVGYFNPTTAGFFPPCPFHAMTGWNCPGCGLTRGFHALFRGDVLSALHYNAMLPVYAFIFGYILISLILVVTRGRGLSWDVFPPAAMYAFLILTIVFSVARNLPFYPFNLLAI
ncbi:MAG: DUF2752 domain-containing protein [Pyrinomonadaceae bacterium]